MSIDIRMASPKFKILDPELYPGFKFRGVKGGRGGAKSHSIARVLIANSLKFHDMFIVCARDIQKSLKESAYKLIVDTIASLGLSSQFECVDSEIRCKSTRSRFIFIGMRSNPDSIKSLESAHRIWIEEANKVSMETWEILVPTMRAKGWDILASWNPDLPTDPVEVVFEREKHRAIVAVVTYLDNPYLDPSKVEEAEHMKTVNPELYAHVYLGSFRAVGDDAVVPLRDIMSAQARVPVKESVPLVAALDVAYFGDNESVLSFREGAILHPLECWQGLETTQLERKVAERMLDMNCGILIVDAGGSPGVAQHIQEIVGASTKVVSFLGQHAASNRIYSNARAENWFRMAEWIKTVGRLPDDRKLQDQLMIQTFRYNSNNQRALPTKQDMRKAGLSSPDRPDSVSMTFATAAEHASVPKLVLSDYRRRR